MESILTTKEAAKILNISVRAVRALLKRGTLTGKQLGREWAVDQQSVLGYKARKEAKKNR